MEAERCSARSEQIVLHEDGKGREKRRRDRETIARNGRGGFNRCRFDSRINGKLIFYAYMGARVHGWKVEAYA